MPLARVFNPRRATNCLKPTTEHLLWPVHGRTSDTTSPMKNPIVVFCHLPKCSVDEGDFTKETVTMGMIKVQSACCASASGMKVDRVA